MKNILFSGLHTLNCADSLAEQFGTIGATSSLDTPGNLELFLDIRKIPAIIDDTGIHITLTEAQAEALYTMINKTLVRIEHLRVLHRLGKLDSNAIYEDTDTDS